MNLSCSLFSQLSAPVQHNLSVTQNHFGTRDVLQLGIDSLSCHPTGYWVNTLKDKANLSIQETPGYSRIQWCA